MLLLTRRAALALEPEPGAAVVQAAERRADRSSAASAKSPPHARHCRRAAAAGPLQPGGREAHARARHGAPVRRAERGQRARVTLASGKQYTGVIGYISRTADALTRTFQVEVAIDNADLGISAGLTADVVLFTKPAMAHRVTPAVLTLNDQGQIGIKVVGDDNVVKFHAIEIVADTSDGVWVTGLPHTARVISVGQEFVLDGQTVNPVHTGS